MQRPILAMLLRVFVGEDDRHGHQPLYQAIVLKTRELHLADATERVEVRQYGIERATAGERS